MPVETSRQSLARGDTPTARDSLYRSRTRSTSSSNSTNSATGEMAPMSNSSTVTLRSTSGDSCELVKEKRLSTKTLQGTSTESAKPMSPVKSVDLAAYYIFSKRNSKVQHDEMQGLSGFLDYRKINGTWRPFLFQTSGHQLMLYRVYSTHQVLIMSTDIRSASEIALEGDGADENTRLLRLGVNGTTITLRAVTHRAAVYWVDGLRRLRDGKALQIVGDASCTEPDEDIFVEIDKLLTLREWTPPPSPASLCGLCILSRRPEPLLAGVLMKRKKMRDKRESSGCTLC